LSWWDEAISYGDLAAAKTRKEVWLELVAAGKHKKSVLVALETQRGLTGVLEVPYQRLNDR